MLLWHFVSIFAVALFWILPAQLDAYVTQSTGCYHNGTWYADKSLVPTVEKCLNCQCNKKTLVCRLKVCPEMPMPPPRGCIVVQKKNTCCPYLSCARLESFYKIPATRRIIAYLDHYERESIDRVVNENMLQRRSDDTDVDLYVCVKNGTVYKSGSAMSSSNLCTYCYCIGGSEKCVKPKCMLPVEGCKPIFVDSTCCPVRYDCSTKTSGKSSQEVRYRKTSNKHFLRMSQRPQRNRGCTVEKQFYAEGQKMKSDLDKPCDICFCIRGTRRCAPKKCSPALKNCMPVVPKGQCCPSSYDCGSQRDYRRAQSSRQFNLYNLLFGKDQSAGDKENGTNTIPEQYPHDRHPAVTAPLKMFQQKSTVKPLGGTITTEKSIFDTIREGLEFIDGNNNQMLADNIDLLAMQTAAKTPTSTSTSTTVRQHEMWSSSVMPPNISSSTTEVSLLDLLLGPDTESELPNNQTNNVEDTSSTAEMKTTPTYDGLSWVDLLLGTDEEELKQAGTTNSDKLDTTETTTHYEFHATPDYSGTSSIDRLDDDFDDFSGSGEIAVGEHAANEQSNLFSTKRDQETTTQVGSTLESTVQTTETIPAEETTQTFPTTLSATVTEEIESTTEPMTTTTEKLTTTTEKATTRKKPSTTKPKLRTTTSTTTVRPTTKSKLTVAKTRKPPTKLSAKPAEKLHKTDALPLGETHKPLIANATATPAKPDKTNNLLTALLDGISGILANSDKFSNSTAVRTKSNGTSTATTLRPVSIRPATKPLPLFKPIPHRINSKISNLTVNPAATIREPNITSFKPLPPLPPVAIKTTTTTTATPKLSTTTVARITTTTSTTTTTEAPTTSTTTTTTTTTTAKPLVIKTNPSILESEPLETNAEPTLPPSLPNLKIIPFLPTDAVKADRTKPLYDYYHSSGSSNGNNNSPPAAKLDYDLYDDANLYPSITERYPLYGDIEDGSKAEYIYKFNVEGPAPVATSSAVSSTAGKLDGTGSSGGAVAASAFVKYDFVNGVGASLQHKGFSPPTKTEGGFVPKEPLVIASDDIEGNAAAADLKSAESYQVTKHLIDITTGEPMRENTTKLIEITTPDPFKDVIRTELPPDLTSLMEDKEKNFKLKQTAKTDVGAGIAEPNESNIIHITTERSPELKQEQQYSHHHHQHHHNKHNNNKHRNSSANKNIALKNQTTFDDALLNEDRKSIETFLDLFLKGAENEKEEIQKEVGAAEAEESSSSTTIPPFKSLPVNAIKHLHSDQKQQQIQTTTTIKPQTTVTSTKLMQANNIATSPRPTATAPTTTIATPRIKSKPKIKPTMRNHTVTANNKNNNTATLDTIATTIGTLRPTKITKPKLNVTRRISTATKIKTATIESTTVPTTTTTTASSTISSSSCSSGTTTTTTTLNPFLMSPFDKLPFMDASFEVKRITATAAAPSTTSTTTTSSTSTTPTPSPSPSHHTNSLLGLEQYKNTLNMFEGLEPAYESFITTTTTSAPISQKHFEKTSSSATSLSSSSSLSSDTQQQHHHASSNSLIDPTGILKLAGCNIYGRMYRVGRIILELSNPCLECKCTEVGVKCGQLDC